MSAFNPNSVCTIVGAGEGLGRSLAKRFARQGFAIALVSRSDATLAATLEAAERENPNVSVRFFAANVTEPEAVDAAFAKIHEEMGQTEVLLYTARGEFKAYEPLELPIEVLERLFRVEVVGAFAAAKAVLPNMIERGKGSVFFSSATAAFRGSSQYPHYAIGKFGLRALSQSLAKAYSRQGVHVAHMRLDCDLDVPLMQAIHRDSDKAPVMVQPDDIAEAYWLTHQQPKTAWSNEVELRPYTENWTF